MQQQALSMTGFEWFLANALAGGLLGGAAVIASGLIAAIGPGALILVSGVGLIISVGQFVTTVEIILYETGLTTCSGILIMMATIGIVLSTVGIVAGVRAWQASGSILRWWPETMAAGGGQGLVTEPNKAYFWSGRTNGVGSGELAEEIAVSRGGTTLERLIRQRGINMPRWNPNDPASVEAWKWISREYAANASGEVHVVLGEELRPGGVWETVELPELLLNPRITRIVAIDPATLVERIIFSGG
jgi:hypothetical protein